MTKDQKKQVALDLYLRTEKTLQEIADVVDINEKTLRTWRDKYNWETLRSAETSVKTEVIRNLYKKISELSKNDVEKTENIKEIYRLSSIIEKLNQNATLSIYIQVFQEFNEFLKKQGKLGTAKEFNLQQQIFIKEKAGLI